MILRAIARIRPLLPLALLLAACGETTSLDDSEIERHLQLVSGASQEAGAGTALSAPIVVRVLDSMGRPLARTQVRWRVIEGGGSTSEDVTETDSLGDATVRWTLGSDLGLQLLLAEAERSTLTVQATALLAFVQVAAGGAHTCALSTTSQVYCWGSNARGQLGDGKAISTSRPVRSTSRAGFVEITAGWSHSCGITEMSPALCWGDNVVGQLGTGGSGPFQADPVTVRDVEPLVGMSAGYVHTCAVTARGGVVCWGGNASGQLGSQETPVSRVADSGFRSVSSGEFHSCGLRDDGRAECWGWNSIGELGSATAVGAISGPAPVLGSVRFNVIAAGVRHTCAIGTNGDVYCWGRSADGEIGQPPSSHTATPTLIPGVTGFTAVGTGNAHTCGLAAGRAYCWGAILGNGTTGSTHLPTLVSESLTFTKIAVGFEHTCGIADGQVWCWGSNRSGQLGRSDVAFGAAPARVVFD